MEQDWPEESGRGDMAEILSDRQAGNIAHLWACRFASWSNEFCPYTLSKKQESCCIIPV